MKIIKTNYLMLLLLALVFAAPGIFAYLYSLNPQWLTAGKTNKGRLLDPPVLFSKIAADKGKWNLVFWHPKPCEAACLQEVDRLARIRLALGRHLYEVDEWLVSQQTDKSLIQTLQERDIHSTSLVDDFPILSNKPAIFIANAEGYLVLAYETKVKSQDIYHDIKQLLSK